ncbi:putative ABC efflux transporter (ATP-binding protein) [Clostridium neonatale]|nr:Bacitracin transport ATP-binding protein BcrA [Clostridium neonatale]CAI3566068.1 putative ABC efflux transporter (ATP-binding protein) [Clostridium neonatale]CAI3573904.1 putative ABC efflux transporter (ATP-binding protein) [Clostridium neonatale]
MKKEGINLNNIITTTDLCKEYDKTMRVKNLNLEVNKGEVYGFLGPNGAGKSTSLKMLLGLVKPTNGKIEIFNKEFNEKNRISILKNIGSLIESPAYYDHLTGLENMRIMQKLLNSPPKNIDKALEIVRLQNAKDKKVRNYSLGMKQRLGISMAILNFPKLLILDEPTNGLDPSGIHEIRELIKSFPKEYDMTVIISSHLLNEIDMIATQVGIITEGKLVFQDKLEKLHEKGEASILLKSDNLNKAQNILNMNGFSSKIKDDYLVLGDIKDNVVSRINSFLVKSGVNIYRIEKNRKTLEEIFMELTGKESTL